MKTLFICPTSTADFVMDALWAGLMQQLGLHKLIDWPVMPWRRRSAVNRKLAPRWQYFEERESMCYALQNLALPEWSLDDVRKIVESEGFERVFLPETAAARHLYQQAGLGNTPVVVVSAWDAPRASIGHLLRWYGSNLEAVFLDNWLPEFQVSPNFHPINYAMSNLDQFLPDDEARVLRANKKYDVCFVGANTHSLRTRHFDALRRTFPKDAEALVLIPNRSGPDRGRSGWDDSQFRGSQPVMLRREYLTKMAQARVCVNIFGAAKSGKTVRFYEIPWVGSLMVTSPVYGQVWELVDGVHCLYFNTIPEMLDKVWWALAHPQQAEEIALAGHKFVRQYYGAKQMVEYVYSKLRGQDAAK